MISKELQWIFAYAVEHARQQRHELVCLEHVMYAMLQDRLASQILRACGADLLELKEGLEQALSMLETLPSGVDVEIEQTLAVTRVLQRAALHIQSSGKKEIDAGDILAAIFLEPESRAVYLLKKQGISRLDILEFISHGISKDSFEPNLDEDLNTFESRPEPDKPASDPLEAFTTNLVQLAQQGQLDPLIGRTSEITRTMHVLCRRRKNNPVFVGEAGVGKTAVAEGLAQAISAKEVPEVLRQAQIFSLDLGAMIAGTKYRGEFEQRLKAVIQAITTTPDRILFIDEIHNIIGAGAVGGSTLDASNILKPALSTGQLRCMGSTTFEDFKRVFEKDRALARRFQKIEIKEPSVHETTLILQGLRKHYEEYHGVSYTNLALKTAAELAHKHINDRFLPDKAIDIIDEAGAAVRLQPASKRQKRIRPKDVQRVVAGMAQIPTQTVSTDESEKLKSLRNDLALVIYGQDQAVESLVTAIKLSRSGLSAPNQPVGSFLFSGPTGVGKTELARQLARILGIELIRFDMSEYMEKHAVSRLIGAPPGYVGFDQGGLLTDAVIKTPHCVVLLDEIEKAHLDLHSILLQVMDHATLTDNNGRKADFRNVILIMTTNAGAFQVEKGSIGFSYQEGSSQDGKEAIEKTFPPEFRNRLNAWIRFDHLTSEVIEQVVDKLISELDQQLMAKKVSLSITQHARSWLANHGYNRKFGARPMSRLIDRSIRHRLADEILFGQLSNGGSVVVDEQHDELQFTIEPRKTETNTPTPKKGNKLVSVSNESKDTQT